MYADIKNLFYYSFIIHFFVILFFIVVFRHESLMPLKTGNCSIVNIVAYKDNEPQTQNNTNNEINQYTMQAESVKYQHAANYNELSQSALNGQKYIKQGIKDTPGAADDFSGGQIKSLQQALTMNLNRSPAHGNIGYFYKNVRSSVAALIYDSVPDKQIKQFDGKAALIRITYFEDGNVGNISFASDDGAELADVIINNVQWHSIPSPFKYNLPYKELNLKITFAKGGFSIGIEMI